MEKYSSFIYECTKEFEANVKNSYSAISITDKMKTVFNKVEEVTKARCPQQYQKYQSLINNINGQNQPLLVQGKELEAQKAAEELMQCQGHLGQVFLAIQAVSKMSETLMSNELQLCLEDSIKIENEEDAKKSIKTCFNYTFKYTLTASHKMIEQSIRQVDELLKKL
jgi:hypothetical protein